MPSGRYLNPKYRRRQQRRRRLTLVVAATALSFCCVTAIYRVDTNIRQTMLPAAPPVAELRELGWRQYELELFGRQLRFSTEWAVAFGEQLGALARTPPPAVRLYYQLRAQLTGQLPRNMRDNPKAYLDL